jgi:methylated-DNA-[protein]-cysteine S-methyltransferase
MNYILKTKYGNININANPNGIQTIRIGTKSNKISRSEKHPDRNLERLIFLLKNYFQGKKVDFNIRYDISYFPTFTQKVLKVVASIPYGKTTTYSKIAKRIGRPKASRAVGQAVGSNPLPIVIPCHRVIRKDGSLGGFAYGLNWKRTLLKIENIIPTISK